MCFITGIVAGSKSRVTKIVVSVAAIVVVVVVVFVCAKESLAFLAGWKSLAGKE